MVGSPDGVRACVPTGLDCLQQEARSVSIFLLPSPGSPESANHGHGLMLYLLVIEPSKRISDTWNVNSKQQRAAKGGTEVQSSVRHGGRGLSLSPQRHAMQMDAGGVLVLSRGIEP